ncbi:hypothetical protein [Stenotrophomonas ginsengisoli]|nr:hypothetical protein [Stenotrophomonas ginsengisoli]
MLNSVDAGRRLMLRAAVYPLAAIVALALIFLLISKLHAVAVLASGLAVVAGGWLAARIALNGGAQAAASAVGRLVAAMALKWVLVIGVLAIGIIQFRFPPMALLAGIAVGMMFQVLALARR